MLFVDQMLIGAVVDIALFQKVHQELVVPLWRRYDIALDAVILRNLGSFLLQGDFADFSGNGMLSDILNGAGTGCTS